MGFIDHLRGIKNFIRGVLSEADGTPSSTRVLMFVFSIFTLWLLVKIFFHIFAIADTTALTIWLSNIPLLITALMGLIALPYTINKGAGAITETFSGLANMMASAKQVQLNANISDKLTEAIRKVQGGSVAVPGASSDTGSNGPKG